jgi:hypothetical protein
MSRRIAVLVMLLTCPVSAITPRPTPKFCAEYFEADTVFVGDLLAVGNSPSPGQDVDVNYLRYRFRVRRALRGAPGATDVSVLTENSSSRWTGDIGKRYVVFVQNGMIAATGGPLDQPSYVRRVSTEVAAIRRATSATVEGDVVRASADHAEQRAAGIRVRLDGHDRRVTAMTDLRGRFSFVVPPGQYLLVVDGGQPSVYSKGGAEPFTVAAGQCAQFEFEVAK